MMEYLLDEFNHFFEGDAEVVINKGRLEITIDSRTLPISLPQVLGAQAVGEKAKDLS
ncbi:hypothetical protein ACFLST_00730 [Chloroflexota bacterium]